MTVEFERIEKEIQALTNKEKAALAYRLIEELDGGPDEGVEKLWAEERGSGFRLGVSLGRRSPLAQSDGRSSVPPGCRVPSSCSWRYNR